MEELKRCPFCGGIPYISRRTNQYGVEFFIVQCPRCRTTSGGSKDKKFAIDSWNIRTGGEENA